MEYKLSEIKKSDKRENQMMNALLEKEGILRDANLDYSIGLFDDDYNLVATGSVFKNTLRCMAVDSSHRGEGLLNQIVSSLIEYQYSIGNQHLFLYTKPEATKFFHELGFYEIARISDKLVFMENDDKGFNSYINELIQYKKDGKCAAIVMNANPFTLGHKHIVKTAAKENDFVHLFVVSEDISSFSTQDRYQMVLEGVKEFDNVICHLSGSYIISCATFPSYFLKEGALIANVQAKLDASLFARIAKELNIKARYIGEEPLNETTKIYNEVLKSELPKSEIDVIELPRITADNEIISASTVREYIKSGNMDKIKSLVPASTFEYIKKITY